MKTLYLLRHAKSSWDDVSLSDFDRPLNDRGRRTAPFIGEFMRKRGFMPKLIVSSPAVRAKETAIAVRDAAGLKIDLVFDREIYEATSNTLRKVVAGLDDIYSSAMLVGHNPGMEGLLHHLTGRFESIPTAALAVLNVDIQQWRQVGGGVAEVVDLIRPKEHLDR